MNIRAILSIAWSDTLHVFRVKSVIFWTIIFPVLLVLISAFVWFNPEQTVTYTIGLIDQDHSNGTQWLLEAFSYAKIDNKSLFKVKEYTNLTVALDDLLKDKLDAVLLVPEGFTKNITSGFSANLKFYVSAKNPTKSMIVKSVIEGFMTRFSKELAKRKIDVMLRYVLLYANMTGVVNETVEEYIKLLFEGVVEPVNLTVEEVQPKGVSVTRENLIAWAVVGIIAVESLFIGLTRGSTVIVEEKEYGTLYRLLASPITGWELLTGKTLGVLVAVALAGIASTVTGIALGARILFNPLNPASWIALAMIVLTTLFFTGLGLILSMIARSEAGAVALSNALAFTLMFTSGVWWPPKEWLPEPLKTIAYHNPATLAVDAARNILAYNQGLEEILPTMPFIITGTIIVYVIGVIVYKKLLSKIIE